MKRNALFQHQYTKAPKRSTFDLSHDFTFSCNMGQIVPILVQEALPGDTWRISAETLVRFQPLIAPVYQRFRVYRNYFFVPNRILWKNWEKFIDNSDADITTAMPTIKLRAQNDYELYGIGSLADYIGLVPVVPDVENPENNHPSYDPATNTDVNALPFAAYQKIYYEYFRDQNLIDGEDTPIPGMEWFRPGESLPDGVLENNVPLGQRFQQLMLLRIRAWKKDYFTSALTRAQKGDLVMIPMAFQDVPVYSPQGEPMKFVRSDSYEPFGNSQDITTNAAGNVQFGSSGVNAAINGDENDETAFGNIWADTSRLSAPDATINNLRVAFQVQKWLELNNIGGTRYVEFLQKHFGVAPRDERLQRPEYIGGDSQNVVISEVLQTTPTQEVGGEEEGALGDFAGHAITAKVSPTRRYNVMEHGYIIGLMSVMPEALYWQGVQKFLWKKLPFDFAFPTFANLGEQEILKKELLYDFHDSPYVNQTFGYTPRYAEYKFVNNRTAAEFRTTLDFWHYGRRLFFGEGPGNVSLNKSFIEYSNDKRIFAVIDQDEDEVLAHVAFRLYVTRPLPKYGTPISLS